jgi:2-polyprenyl-3-methyl-5-hydroxy-6-metoxy-1,4-benzoquinol methylase
MDEYWNHNVAYHPWVLRKLGGIESRPPRVLDVGCGDGLLVQQMTHQGAVAVGIDIDPSSVERAEARLRGRPNAAIEQVGFAKFDPGPARFDLITFVASIHHMDLRSTLRKARELITPAGTIAVVGLSTNRSPADWAIACLQVLPVWVASTLHRETRDIGVPVSEPSNDLREIKAIAADEIPGARIRRGLYYRYLIDWSPQ